MDAIVKVSATAHVPTDRSARYLEQLCKHFEHRLPVTRGEDSGSITFSIGTCDLKAAPDHLALEVSTTDPAELESLEDVVARHLKRFMFREEPDIRWTSP